MSALRPSLGLTHATAMVVGTIIGASIFVQPSEITKLMPSVSGILLVWLAAGVLTLAGALVCAELASAFPQTGGVYVFLKEAYLARARLPLGLGDVLEHALRHHRRHRHGVRPIRCAVRPADRRGPAARGRLRDCGAVGGELCRRPARRLVQNVFTAAKVLAILAIISAGLAWHGPARAVASASAGAGDLSVRGLILAIAAGLFAYGGWHMVTYTAGETKDPARTIPRALLIGTLIVTACYAGLNAIYLRVLPLEAVRGSSRVAAEAADALLGGGGASIMAALVMISTFGAVNGIILVGPRVYYSMARDGLLFRSVAAVHPVFGTPHRAIVLQAIWSSALALTNTYGALFSRVIYTEWIFFALMAAGLMRLRRRPDYRPSYRIAGYPLVPDHVRRRVGRDCGDPDVGVAARQSDRHGHRDRGPAGVWLVVAPEERHRMIIDVHNHYYPPEYLDALGPSGSTLRITHDAEGNPVVHYPGDYNVMVRGHRDIAYRQTVLDETGVDVQVISLTTPGTHVETPPVAAKLATITNDAFARVRRRAAEALHSARDAAALRSEGISRRVHARARPAQDAGRDALQQRQRHRPRRRAVLADLRGRQRPRRHPDDPSDLSGRRRSDARVPGSCRSTDFCSTRRSRRPSSSSAAS